MSSEETLERLGFRHVESNRYEAMAKVTILIGEEVSDVTIETDKGTLYATSTID